jgi:hypothetical protein
VRRLGVLAAAGDGPERGLLGGVLLAPLVGVGQALVAAQQRRELNSVVPTGGV